MLASNKFFVSGQIFSTLSAGLLLVTIVLLTSCAHLVGAQQFELPLTKLQDSLNRRFPIDERIMTVFDVRLTQPQLAILPAQDKIALSMDLMLTSPLSNQARHGQLTLSGRLVVDNAHNAIAIRDVNIDRLDISGTDDEKRRQLTAVLSLLANQLIKDLPLYHFVNEDLRRYGVQFRPSKIVTTSSSLIVIFEPQS